MFGQTGNPYAGGVQAPMRVYYTAKNINATAGSRSAIASDIKVGHIVILDPYSQDEQLPDATPGALCVTQAQTSFLAMPAYVVTDVSPAVNEIPDSVNAATQRRGGMITVEPLAFVDRVQAHVDGTTDIAVGDPLAITNASWDLKKGTDFTDDLGSVKAVAHQAFTTDAEGTIRVGRFT